MSKRGDSGIALKWCLLLSAVVTAMDARPAASLPKQPSLDPAKNSHLTKDGEFWTRWNSDTENLGLETQQLNAGIFTAENGANFVSKVHQERIVKLEKGCGRGKNRLATFSDGTKACCRYRQLQWRDIRGEFYTYHLNNLLGMRNAPPASLVKISFSSPQWKAVKDSAMEAEWTDHTTIIMTKFVEGLAEETIPPVMRDQKTIVTEKDIEGVSTEEKARILQWSDLIVFDFLVGHSDRIFNTLFNLQWNNRMLDSPVHNLMKTEEENKLLLFDNESGFWLGYKMGWKESIKYELQERFLKKTCVFRSRTVEKVRYLLHGEGKEDEPAKSDSATKRLERYIKAMDESSFQMVEPLAAEQRREFEARLKLVLQQVQECGSL